MKIKTVECIVTLKGCLKIPEWQHSFQKLGLNRTQCNIESFLPPKPAFHFSFLEKETSFRILKYFIKLLKFNFTSYLIFNIQFYIFYV